MDIDCIQEHEEDEIEYRQHIINKKFEDFYRKKFEDLGKKEIYCNQKTIRKKIMEIKTDEIVKAIKQIPVKACTWDRLPL